MGPITGHVVVIDQNALVRAFHTYTQALLHTYDIGPVLYGLVDQVVQVLDVDGAGVSLARDGRTLAFVAATDADVTALEETQVALNEGPCHEAFSTGKVVTVVDLRDQDRWTEYCHTAVDRGIHSVVGIPMPIGERRIGALDLYRREAHHWEGEELHIAQLLAEMASGYVLNAAELSESRTMAGQLQHALDSRVIVEQAKGILAERHDIEPSEAFRRLRQHARATQTNVHDVAHRVVDEDFDVPG